MSLAANGDQLAGAYWGESGIPQEWRDGLAGNDIIEPILKRLVGEKALD